VIRFVSAASVVLCFSVPLHSLAAQSDTTIAAPAVTPASKVATAVRLEGQSIRVDARLDDAAWRGAQWFSDFIQKDPVEGAAPTERTEVAFLYDDAALYVAARMYSNDPSKIQAPLARRDNTAESEHIWISLDTYRDRRTAYSFGISASGVRMDWYHPTDNEFNLDPRWDPVWEAKAVIDSVGWTAEMRIPFSQLRFTRQDEQVWGLNIDRWVPSRREDIFWIPVPKNVTAWSSRMGTLTGIRGIRPSRRLEVLPYTAGNATLTGARVASDPFDDGKNLEARAGADIKMGLGPNLTLDATVNPDFGQVEADPAVVNLTAFEVFFDERRPFFTEGSQLLASQLFYSRRVGGPPRGGAAGDFVDYPSSSTILGAAKVTGRLPSGLSVGALGSVTAREWARTYDATTLQFGRTEVAPLAAYGVARVQQEFGPSQSTVGGLFTVVQRDVNTGSPLAAIYPRSAYSGRVDANLRFGGGAYQVGGQVALTGVRGDAPAMLRIQRSAVHYFQRPDADHVEVDPARTSLTGYNAGLSFEKISGRHWLYGVDLYQESPGYDPNDAGRLGNADGQGAFANLRWRETRPGRWFHNYTFSFETGGEWNFGGDRQFYTTRWDAQFTWKNWAFTNLTFWVDWPSQNHALTRGGPSMAVPRSWVTIVNVGTGFASTTRWSGRVYYGHTALGGETYRLSGSFAVRPSTRLQLSVAPNYLHIVEPRQYIATLDSGLAATYFRRYVFGRLLESEFLVQFRMNYTLAPDLTLEVYAEPFAAGGRYSGFGELGQPRTYDLRFYSSDPGVFPNVRRTPTDSVEINDLGGYSRRVPNPDFNVLSFRSNAVLRWEWRPGSTLFLVWQQNRFAGDTRGQLVGPRDLWDTLRATGDNFFAIKVSYWIPVN
jgi:uncharacterized protein DUF5916